MAAAQEQEMRDVALLVNRLMVSMLMTDEATLYCKIGMSDHFTVEHGKNEYVRGSVHVNTLEGTQAVSRWLSAFSRAPSQTWRVTRRVAFALDVQEAVLRQGRGVEQRIGELQPQNQR